MRKVSIPTAMMAAVAFALVRPAHAAVLYVTSFVDGGIYKVDTNSPSTPTLFAAPVAGVSDHMSTLVYGPDGNFYAGSESNNKILKYNGTTGAYLGVVADSSSGLAGPLGLAFGADNNLYVSSAGSGSILKYSTTGIALGRFDNGGSPITPGNIAFGPDGNLYVVGALSADIYRFNGSTGASMGTFVTRPGSGYSGIGALAFGSDGDLYATTSSNEFDRYNGTTGQADGTFFNPSTSFFNCLDGLFADGRFYATAMEAEAQGNGGIYAFDATTGTSFGRLITDSSFEPGALAVVVPEPASMALLAAGSMVLLGRRARRGGR